MDYAYIVIAITALLGLYMAWNIGANDAANSMADAVGSKAVSLKYAVALAAVFELVGAVLVGSHVTDTVRKGIVSPGQFAGTPEVLVLGMACALLAAALWLNLATWFGMPVSTTHSIVGAVAGFGVVAAGLGAVNWAKMGAIVGSWFVSPVMGAVVAFIVFKFISRFILGATRPASAAVRVMPYVVLFITMVVTLATVFKGLKNVQWNSALLTGMSPFLVAGAIGVVAAMASRILLKRRLLRYRKEPIAAQLEQVERAFAPLVVLTSCGIAFAHGANDVANSIGPLAAVAEIVRSGKVGMAVPVPMWVLGLGGIGIALGLVTFGYRVMLTVGTKITQLTPSRGVAADVAATTVVLVCTLNGWPISTTHVLVGAIMGVGFARGLGAVNRRVTRNIFASWIVTVPAAALLAIVLFLVTKPFLLGVLKTLISSG
jgi:PiT family inorganic phosphate transporter